MATALRMNSMVVDEKSFKLDEIKGAVHTTQKLTLGPFENATVTGILKGLVKNSSYHKHVNVSLEPLDKDNVDTSGRPIEVVPSRPEVDKTPLSPEQMKTLFEQIKTRRGNSRLD